MLGRRRQGQAHDLVSWTHMRRNLQIPTVQPLTSRTHVYYVCLALAYQRIRAAGRSRQTRMLQPRSFSKHASDPAADLACVHALRITVSRAGVRPWGRPATPTQQRTAIVAPKGSAACLLAAGKQPNTNIITFTSKDNGRAASSQPRLRLSSAWTHGLPLSYTTS